MDEIADAICAEIAEGMVMSAIDTMAGMCVNEGQSSLIDSCAGDYEDQIEDVANGDFSAVESDHPEAVGGITEVGNMICETAAEICDAVRAFFEALDFFF